VKCPKSGYSAETGKVLRVRHKKKVEIIKENRPNISLSTRSVTTLSNFRNLQRRLGRYRRKCEDNIKRDLAEMSLEVLGWIHLFRGRDKWQAVVKSAMSLQLP
jgi:hypothetical protein